MYNALHCSEAWTHPGKRQNGCCAYTITEIIAIGDFTIGALVSFNMHPQDYFDSICLNDGSLDMGLNQVPIIRRHKRLRDPHVEMRPDALYDQSLHFRCRHASHRPSISVASLEDRVGDIISVANSLLDCVRRGHPITAIVKQAAGKKGG